MDEIRCGVEIEVSTRAPYRIAAALPELWQCDHSDVEAISPILRTWEQARREITAACKALRALGCAPSDDKGLHVHLSREHLGEAGCRRLMIRYYRAIPRFNRRWPHRARSLSPGCTLLRTGSVCPKHARPNCDPTLTYDRHRPPCGPHRDLDTIEVRQHPSTLDPDEILAWIAELYAMATEPEPREQANHALWMGGRYA